MREGAPDGRFNAIPPQVMKTCCDSVERSRYGWGRSRQYEMQHPQTDEKNNNGRANYVVSIPRSPRGWLFGHAINGLRTASQRSTTLAASSMSACRNSRQSHRAG